MVWLYIALGGAVGALARHGLVTWLHQRLGFEFPWGTLAVNLIGSLLIGVALRLMDTVHVAPETRALVVVGLLGAFTTFSTFSYEIVALIEAGAWARAAAYVSVSLLVGVAAVVAGMAATGAVLMARG